MEPAAEKVESTAGSAYKAIAFIALVQVLALYITLVNAPVTQATGPITTPGGPSATGSVYNAVILVAFVMAATLAAVWLAKRRKVKVFLAVVFVGTALALFVLTLLASIDITATFMDEVASFYLSIFISAALVVVLGVATFRRKPAWLALVVTGALSAEVGSYFAATLPYFTALLIPVAFSLYDIYAVFKGPLRTLLTTVPAESLSAISSHIGDFSIGTGDTVFYAMIPALVYYRLLTKGASLSATLGSAIIAVVAVDIGVAVTFYFLGKAKLLPGLPIPMALGLTALVLVFLFFGVLNVS